MFGKDCRGCSPPQRRQRVSCRSHYFKLDRFDRLRGWRSDLRHNSATRARSSAQHLAHHDPLTGLYNRVGFAFELNSHLNEKNIATLLALDLDVLKGPVRPTWQPHRRGDIGPDEPKVAGYGAQSVPLFQLVAGGDPARCDDVRALSAVTAER